jgi:hypothetical protein
VSNCLKYHQDLYENPKKLVGASQKAECSTFLVLNQDSAHDPEPVEPNLDQHNPSV